MERMIVYLVGLAAVLCGYALLMRSRRAPEAQWKLAPRTLVFTIIAAASVVGLAIVLVPVLFSWARHPAEGDGEHTGSLPLEAPPSDARRAPLAVGEIAPALAARGWINGAPQTDDARLTVVDIWAFW